jgi:ABC-type multidrug transport system fused ATPase/permease subunit
MYKQYKRILDLLSPLDRRKLLLLIPLMLGGAVIDTLGVASVMPFITVLSNPGVIASNTYLKTAFDFLGFASERDFMRFLALVFFLFVVLSIVYKAMSTYVMSRFSLMLEYSIGHELVRRYLGQPYDWFLNQHSSDLGKSILTEVSRVVGAVIIPLVQLVVQGSIALSLLVLLILVQTQIAVVLGASLVTAYICIYMMQRSYLRKIGLNLEGANRSRFRVVSEAFIGIKSVKVSGLENHYGSAFERPAYEYARNIAASNVATQVPRFALELLAFGGMLGVIFFLMDDYSSFQTMLPVLSVYVLASYRLMPAMQQVYIAVSTLRVAGPTLERLHAEYTALSCPAAKQHNGQLKFENEVRLEAISYKYPGSAKINVSNIDLVIPFTASIGIVGATGSGKTTTIDIILGLLHPGQGRLLVDGVEITASTRGLWQKLIGYVPQQIFLTDDTIAANIAYGVPTQLIDMQLVIEVAKIANLHEFVSSEFPQNYLTVVGERGTRLSGGQIQRIGIARALYRKPRILVLDEATSALDNMTEGAVMDAIANLGHKITIVIVAHRLSTVRACDCIYVMEHGQIRDRGTFDELSLNSGRFQEMIRAVPSLASTGLPN